MHVTFKWNKWHDIAALLQTKRCTRLATLLQNVARFWMVQQKKKLSATCYGQQCWNMSRSLGCVRILPILLTLGRAFAQLQVYINIILTLACHTKLCGFNNKMLYF